jgi:DNA primase
LQIEEVTNNYSVIACYGTNGLNEEIQNAIQELKQLEEIIFCFDNDEAGKEAVNKYGAMFTNEYPNLKITNVEVIGKDVNETLQGHEESIFIELLNKRTELNFSFSIEEEKTKTTPEKPILATKSETPRSPLPHESFRVAQRN